MKTALLPELPTEHLNRLVSGIRSELNTVARWQENLRQTTRHWFRNDGDVRFWLRDYGQLRRNLLADVWSQCVPEDLRASVTYVVFGSSARGEDVFHSDLDHALLFNPAATIKVDYERLRPYLYQFIQVMSSLGFPPCQGNVMSTNFRWVGTPQTWKDRVQRYFDFPDWENVRYLFIMIDSLPIEASSNLPDASENGVWQEIRLNVMRRIQASPFLCWEMAHLGIHNTVPSGTSFIPLFSPHNREIQVKSDLLNPIIHSTRLLAVENSITTLSTFDRLEQLADKQVLDRRFRNDLEDCLKYGLKLRILSVTEGKATASGDGDSVFCATSKEEQELLEKHLHTAKQLEKFVHRRFRKPR